MKLWTPHFRFVRRSLLHIQPGAVQQPEYLLLFSFDLLHQSAARLATPGDILRRCTGVAEQCMRHAEVLVVAMEVGQDPKIFRERQPPLEAKGIHCLREAGGTPGFLLCFDGADLLMQPGREGLFQFYLGSTAIEIIDRLTFFGERDEPARRRLVFQLAGDKPHQQTLAAGMGSGRVAEVGTGKRIFENQLAAPWRVGRSAIATILKKFQFELEEIQQFIRFLCHRPPHWYYQPRTDSSETRWRLSPPGVSEIT